MCHHFLKVDRFFFVTKKNRSILLSYSLVKDFAKIGMGISYITKEFAKEELDNELLFEIPLKEKIPERGLGIVLPKNTITSFATQKFIEILKKGPALLG